MNESTIGVLFNFLDVFVCQQGFISIPGRVVLDGIDTLKTAPYHFRSWSLESVSQELLGEGKEIHNVHDRMDEINRMYRSDKPSLAKYNLQDCVLVNKIFDHTHLLDFAIERSRLTGVELDRVGGSVAAFTNLYLPQIHRAGYVAPEVTPKKPSAAKRGYFWSPRSPACVQLRCFLKTLR